MESFMGQLILDDEIDYKAAREHLEDRIRTFCGNYVYCCCPKEYRQSDEWKEKDLSEKLGRWTKTRYGNYENICLCGIHKNPS